MPVLWRKTVRDVWEHKGSVTALAAIMAVGIGVFAGMASLHRDLDGARDRYYRRQHIAHFTIDLKRTPASAVATVAADPAVLIARGRVQTNVLIDLPHIERPVPGRVLSLPARHRSGVNDVLLRSGIWFQDERQALVLESFAEAVGIGPGDRIRVTLLDKQHDLLVVGAVMSPEFVYVIPPDGGFAPDPSRFGVIYLREDFARKACDLDGAFNQIIGQARELSDASIQGILDRAERRLDAYGVLATAAYDEQPSVRYLLDEIRGLRVSATIVPAIFLGVAVLVLNILLGRIVRQQRVIIGALKALGYSPGKILRHYLAFGVATGLAGAAGGLALGRLLQNTMIVMYRRFFAMPDIVSHVYPDILLAAVAVSVGFACLGALKGVRYANRLQPAEAMAPPPPERGGRILLERIVAVWRRLGFRSRMAARSIFRNPFRSAVSVLAAAVATALILSMLSMSSSLDYLMNYTFAKIAHQDVSVSIREPVDSKALREMIDLPSVSGGESELNIACELRNGPLLRRVGITGLSPHTRLHTPLDDDGNPIAIPEVGLVLSRKLAELLDVRPGDRLRLRPLIGERRETVAVVARTVQTFLGLSAYADKRYLSGLIGEQETANSFLFTRFAGPGAAGFLREIKRRPSVVGLGERSRSLTQIQETFGETMGISIGVSILFAGLIAFGSVINTALVSVGERRREIGTLRVVGYSAAQVAAIFSLESLALNLLGLVLGIALGFGLAHALSLAYDTELYRFPTIVSAADIAQTIGLMLFFAGSAQLVILRIVRRLDWLNVLSIRE